MAPVRPLVAVVVVIASVMVAAVEMQDLEPEEVASAGVAKQSNKIVCEQALEGDTIETEIK